ncbi:hypothetical protein GUJ93_ZPchr0014g46700 [Zizania palustris]|uniref:Uncharacterized protein n=1 Tax=Zizania palustris TaxID=103762 RepID=A0A8J5SY20_ZIZPA|nr:hypothetical protein GUJ93_ZPchr0014g46700 [Zizania palustris]
MRTAKVCLLAALVAACLAYGAESAAARRSLTFDDVDVFPAGPRSDSGMCWELLLTLGMCKHDLLASFLTGCPVPRACCRAVCDVDEHCGPFTRAFVGSLLPHSLMRQCAATATHRAPNVRAAPPRVPAVSVASPRVPSGGARPPPSQDTYTSVLSPPPRAPKHLGPPKAFHRGTHTPPPMFKTSVQFAPPDHPRATSGATLPPSGQDAHTSVRVPPPGAPRFYLGPPKVFPRGTDTPPPRFQTSVQFAPPDDPRVSGGMPPPPRYHKSFRLPPDEEAEINAPLSSPNISIIPVSGGTYGTYVPPKTVHAYGGAAGTYGTYVPPKAVPAYGGAASGGGSEAPKLKMIFMKEIHSSPVSRKTFWLMASSAAPTEFTQEAARQSLIAISRSVPAMGEALSIKSPNGVMADGHDDGADKYRSKLISISNLSPDAQPTPCSPKNTAA